MTGYMEMAKCNRKQRLLGKSIRRIRMRRNMTQRELANAAGLGESALEAMNSVSVVRSRIRSNG